MLLVVGFPKLTIVLFCFGKALDEFKSELFEIVMHYVVLAVYLHILLEAGSNLDPV